MHLILLLLSCSDVDVELMFWGEDTFELAYKVILAWNFIIDAGRDIGTPRTKKSIVKELQKQVKLTCAGSWHMSQTQTGAKDIYTQYWINDLITHFQQLKDGESDCSSEDIKAKLIQWTLSNQDKIYSTFLTMKVYLAYFTYSVDPYQKWKYLVYLQATETIS
ncbi:hypothetical protein C8R44DRAFT_723788 [Mycena epipterygia]|nr:hypothetical protein C8R44DRAFT_723788 [Mycena epipterygia]